MTKFYTILTLSLFIFLVQCKGAKFVKNPPFKIQDSSYNYWVGGVRGVRGVTVQIKGLFTDTDKIQFKQIYFRNHIVDTKKTTKASSFVLIGVINTSNREKITLAITKDSIKKDNNIVAKESLFPFKLADDEIVISYLKNNKIHYFKIGNLKEEKNKYFP